MYGALVKAKFNYGGFPFLVSLKGKRCVFVKFHLEVGKRICLVELSFGGVVLSLEISLVLTEFLSNFHLGECIFVSVISALRDFVLFLTFLEVISVCVFFIFFLKMWWWKTLLDFFSQVFLWKNL